jgi:hypothetical protein
MNLVETHDLLTLAAQYDNRRFDDAVTVAWQELLADLPFDYCRLALLRHFGTTEAYLMPVHVRRGVEEIDRERRRAAREAAEWRALERQQADPTRRDRSAEVTQLIQQVRDRLPAVDETKFRRREVVEWERQAARAARAEPNPHYDPAARAALTKGAP